MVDPRAGPVNGRSPDRAYHRPVLSWLTGTTAGRAIAAANAPLSGGAE